VLIVLVPGVGFLAEINLCGAVSDLGEMVEIEGTPLPCASESLAGRGVCKKHLQNLDGKELRGQNLENM
jgi:hypothetical protein